MEIDPAEVDGSLYRTLSGSVVPRPIAWVSTTSEDGVDNLAPFSFFTVAAIDPPILVFAPVDGPDGLKDTPRNVRDTGELVVNIVTDDTVEAMNQTAATLPADESEFDQSGASRAESTRVSPPRVAESPIAFECELYDLQDVGSSSLILAEVVYVHVADAVTTDSKVDVEKLDAVGRMAGSWYASTEDRFSLERPP
ncbi:flavin reductase family protein [Haloarchaeobius sp. HME9146]|uniref:flavin reductase family protein n=1 Tax=Haloarchaeobius sp. HME9146 TaxID=2978732 RepID=UPI0021C1F689|nr:flavin reductase family protein [Haloarchaeobius sp. HME9146]MCT9096795.1 flavin reductase family protein [Haloarchaeobius sp. HME9146]